MSKQYKNPPIMEAVCEFRFNLESAFDQKAVNLFFDEIKNNFPKKKKGTTHQMQYKVDTKENKDEFSKSFYQFEQFLSENEKTLVQLDKGRLSIHQLKPYQSWQEFFSLVKSVFNSYIKNIKIKSIQRIGLRYINNFEIPMMTFDIEQYFNFRPVVLGGLPQNLSSFMAGVIFVFENGRDNAKAQLMNNPARDSKTPIVFDIDYFIADQNVLFNNQVSDWLETAHQNIENLFEKALTDKTKELFN